MKKIAGLLVLLAGMSVGTLAQQIAKATIILSNPSVADRIDEVMELSWKDIVAKYPDIDTANFKVINSVDGREVPYQFDHGGGNGIKMLLIQLTLKSKAKARLTIVPGKPASVARKVYGRYVPERYDDFAWENDKVAHRMYGKALESRKDNAFGTDVWVKKTNKLVIDDWYKSADYHTDHGDGMDYYSVGFTLGAGDIAPYVSDSIFFPKNYHHWKVLENGPLRLTFQLGYDAWDVEGKEVKVMKTISLDAGSRMNRIAANYTYSDGSALPVVIGIVKRKEPGKVLINPKLGLMGYWEPAHGLDGTTGIGVIATTPVLKMNDDRIHYLIHTIAKNNEPLIYYSGSAWDRGGEVTNAGQWFDYLNNFYNKLRKPIKIDVK
ncbi:MAG TPA: DUF4861 family protein [Pedobacter sp.]|nr:DUF4861 family protein [Pedobacter sp.]